MSSLVAFASFAARNEDIPPPSLPPQVQAAPFIPQPQSPSPSNGKKRGREISPMSSNYLDNGQGPKLEGGGGGGCISPSLPLPPNHLYYPPPPSSMGGDSSAFDSNDTSYGSFGTTSSSITGNNLRFEALLHLLSTPSRRLFAMVESFYSTVDRAYFNQNEFQEDLDALGLSHVQTLTRTEWSRVRAVMGRRRRMSPAFFKEERRRLEEYRQLVRDVQQGIIMEPPPGIFTFFLSIAFICFNMKCVLLTIRAITCLLIISPTLSHSFSPTSPSPPFLPSQHRLQLRSAHALSGGTTRDRLPQESQAPGTWADPYSRL